jgi:succinate dehydrogenase / fumarate reductase cytochrome b subunit
MLGPYYKFQITSLLSITSRVTGLYLSVVTFPVAILWLLALIGGPDSYVTARAALASLPGQLVILLSLLSAWYHLLNGLRHLMWDTGKGFEKESIRATGYAVIAATILLTIGTWALASMGGGS